MALMAYIQCNKHAVSCYFHWKESLSLKSIFESTVPEKVTVKCDEENNKKIFGSLVEISNSPHKTGNILEV